ncbi:TPA: AAA family ATPase, partial [Streptococcus suis]|nr:AAA family ATPase [Streptococcus suis]
MRLFNQKKTQKLSKAERERAKRLRRTMTASTQNTLNYQWLTPDGLMTVTSDTYSKTYRLGDTSYITATDDERLDVIETNADIFQSLDIDNDLQLLILNRRVETTSLSSLRYELTGDGYDDYRKEYNEMITDRFSDDQNTFKIEKYVTITTQA